MKVYVLIVPCADTFFERDGQVIGVFGEFGNAAQRVGSPVRARMKWNEETPETVENVTYIKPPTLLRSWALDNDKIDTSFRIEEHEVQE